MNTRTEHDFIGFLQIPQNAMYGIHSLRAQLNFPNQIPFSIEWYKAVGKVKLACYLTYKDFKNAALKKYGTNTPPISFMSDIIIEALIKAAEAVSGGIYFEHFIIPAIQGGAGTSINMNCNEIITNAALINLGYNAGEYNNIDPVEHANIYQSTNDVIPTALKLCTIELLAELEKAINSTRSNVEHLENKYRNTLRLAYTQMQAAVPTTYGRLFSTYNEALSRDWWRISKCWERIKQINLGGSAIGTALNVPRFMVLELSQTLQKITGLSLTRAENLSDATSNLDSFVEIHGILKAHAVNLEKIVSDIRLLAADINQMHELKILQQQVGSSIMPNKINPVIPEYVISAVHKIYANDLLIASLSAQGCLELNAYLPSIGNAIIESIKLLISANHSLTNNCLNNIVINEQLAFEKAMQSPSITTALIPIIGYHAATQLAQKMTNSHLSIFEANNALGLIDPSNIETLLKPENLIKEGFSLNDLQ